ncbi:MAG: cytidine/deoxycytidylate deaminase family protein [Candidatus Saganbacteria bacterium]|nr:cytidine/deoxycytidylate deaminase family protein [Candidatus Saganbacteria bacterium]
MKDERPSWDEYFMKLTNVVAERATCVKRKVGAVIIKDHRVKEMNIPSGQRHELCRGLHAEQNAIIQAAWHGIKIEGGTMYCTYQPCVICVKMMINAGIKKLVFSGGYPDELAAKMLKESGLEIKRFESKS